MKNTPLLPLLLRSRIFVLFALLSFTTSAGYAADPVLPPCAGSLNVSRFRLLLEPVKGGTPLPLQQINIVDAGQKLKYEPLHIPPAYREKAKIALILVAFHKDGVWEKTQNGEEGVESEQTLKAEEKEAKEDVHVLPALPAKDPQEWTIPARATVVGIVFGPHGLDLKKVLTKLNSLTLYLQGINILVENEFLNNIFYIVKIEISSTFRIDDFINDTTKEKLCTIIQKQKNRSERLFNNLLLSLEFQKHSLVYIEFEHINFNNISFENFINLCNLQYLKFDHCKGISLDKCDILIFASFDLKELIFIRNTWNDYIIPLMIKYLGSSLRRLLLTENLTIPLIENISI